VNQSKQAADAAAEVLRLAMEATATGTVGPFARGGKSRALGLAVDHDCQPVAPLTPVGSFLPALDALLGYGVTATVPSDGLADRLVQWWEGGPAAVSPHDHASPHWG